MPAARRRFPNLRRSFRRKGPSPTLVRAQAQLKSLRSRYSMAKKKGGAMGAESMSAIATVGGGAAGAVIDRYIPFTVGPLGAKELIGIGLCLTAIFGKKQVGAKAAGWMCAIGGGILAVSAYEFTQNMLPEAEEEEPDE